MALASLAAGLPLPPVRSSPVSGGRKSKTTLGPSNFCPPTSPPVPGLTRQPVGQSQDRTPDRSSCSIASQLRTPRGQGSPGLARRLTMTSRPRGCPLHSDSAQESGARKNENHGARTRVPHCHPKTNSRNPVFPSGLKGPLRHLETQPHIKRPRPFAGLALLGPVRKEA